jgi:hypothetical protein
MNDFAHKVDAAVEIAVNAQQLLVQNKVIGFGGLVTVDVEIQNVEQFAYLVSLDLVSGADWSMYVPKVEDRGTLKIEYAYGDPSEECRVRFWVPASIEKDCRYYLEYVLRAGKFQEMHSVAMKITGEIPF